MLPDLSVISSRGMGQKIISDRFVNNGSLGQSPSTGNCGLETINVSNTICICSKDRSLIKMKRVIIYK